MVGIVINGKYLRQLLALKKFKELQQILETSEATKLAPTLSSLSLVEIVSILEEVSQNKKQDIIGHMAEDLKKQLLPRY